jgi:hypothetical protein
MDHSLEPICTLDSAICHERRPRKGHKKSRQGCLECKRRKIKVDLFSNPIILTLTKGSVKKAIRDAKTARGYHFVAATFPKQPLQQPDYLCNALPLYTLPMSLVWQTCGCFIIFLLLRFPIFPSDLITYGCLTSPQLAIRLGFLI